MRAHTGGCPGWYEAACCSTWTGATQAEFDAFMASPQGVALGYTGPATAADFAMSPIFKAMPVEQNSSAPEGFAPYLAGGAALGCKVDADRKNSYKTLAYVVPSAAGLAGGIFRLPNSFVTPIVGGRNVVYMTTLLLCVPCVWMALALSNPNVAYLQITIAAMTSGVGGGAFASSMANISPFFPKRQQGYGLGMNGGLGNLGVSLCQLFLPILFVTGESWNSIGGTWISNGGWFLFPCCLAAATIAFFFMNNMPKSVHPVPDGFLQMFGRYAALQAPAYVASAICILILYAWKPPSHSALKIVRVLVLILIACIIEHVFIWFGAPGAAKETLNKQIVMFKDKHTWIMTYLYIMTFGSFIGFSNAFPKLILDLFDEYGSEECAELMAADNTMQDCSNPNSPARGFSPAFLGAMIGSLIRPLGGMMSDRFGGARVTHYHTLLMTITTTGLGFICIAARNATRNRTAYYAPFFTCFMILFYCTGVGNGSTFRQIGVLFDKTLAPPVLGWSSAIASFGAFLIPQFFGVFIGARTPEVAFFIFAGYYFTCLFVNWWYYFGGFGRTPEKPC